jgi:hypothetical protein
MALDLDELDLLRCLSLTDERDVVVRFAPHFVQFGLFEQLDQETRCDVILERKPNTGLDTAPF